MPLHTVSTPIPPIALSEGQWINVTSDPANGINLGICIGFLQNSTSKSGINSNAAEAYKREFALQRNIEAGRATLWLWKDSNSIPRLTIVFHASDGNAGAGVPPPRFFVCAGLDQSLSSDQALTLLKGAVSQFASNNHVNTDKIWLFTEEGKSPMQGDFIFEIFETVITNDCQKPGGTHEPFDNKRFPNSIRTYQLNPNISP
jgi:hypothetical protein